MPDAREQWRWLSVMQESSGSDTESDGRASQSRSRKRACFDRFSAILLFGSIILTTFETMPEADHFYYDDDGRERMHLNVLDVLDLLCTFGFVAEYAFRCNDAVRCTEYVCSFFGILDTIVVCSCVAYAAMICINVSYSVAATFRMLRILRLLKIIEYVPEAQLIVSAIKDETRTLIPFLVFLVIIIILLGSLLFAIEDGKGGFHSIPSSVWWAGVTLTTVGYGDITPQTSLGKFVALMGILIGYGIIAVPTIVSAYRGKAPEDGRERSTASLPPLRSHVPSCDVPDLSDARSAYPYKMQFPTRLSDKDRHGDLSSLACYCFVELAVCTFLTRERPLWDLPSPELPKAIVMASSCKVISPCALPPSLDVGIVVERMHETSCVYRVGIFIDGHASPCFVGKLEQAWFDSRLGYPVPIPEHVRATCERIVEFTSVPELDRAE